MDLPSYGMKYTGDLRFSSLQVIQFERKASFQSNFDVRFDSNFGFSRWSKARNRLCLCAPSCGLGLSSVTGDAGGVGNVSSSFDAISSSKVTTRRGLDIGWRLGDGGDEC